MGTWDLESRHNDQIRRFKYEYHQKKIAEESQNDISANNNITFFTFMFFTGFVHSHPFC